MPLAGQSYVVTIQSPESSDRVLQAIISATAGTRDYSIAQASNTVILTRRYIPQWAVVVGVLGILLFLIGLLAFLVRDTETLTITVMPTAQGTQITASGLASAEMIARLNGILAGLQQGTSDVQTILDRAEGVHKIGWQGSRYLLGSGADFFGIWDRTVSGPPIERFPKTDQGWSFAWTRFTALEPFPYESPILGAQVTSDQQEVLRRSEGAERIGWQGSRFLLGRGADFFGIWDRTVPGPPIERFPRTDQGWSFAWTRFTAIEPSRYESPIEPSGLSGAALPAGASQTPVQENASVPPPVVSSAEPQPSEAESTEAQPEMKTCPDCAEQVMAAARVCRYCGFRFDSE